MKNKKIKIIISVICIIALFAVASVVSLTKFHTHNSIAVTVSLAKLYLTDAEYVEVQESPRIIVSESRDINSFFEYLENEGYARLENEQMGSLHIVEKNGQKEAIISKINSFYSLWTWQ